MPKPIAHHEAGFAVLFIAALQRHNRFPISVFGIGADDVLSLGGKDMLIGRFLDRLAGVFVQLRLHIEAFEVTHPAAKKDPNHTLGGWMKMRIQADAGSASLVAKQHRGKSQAGKTHSGFQEGTARNAWATVFHNQRIVTKSLWFIRTSARFSRARSGDRSVPCSARNLRHASNSASCG